jgi:hypothetical protein
VQESNLSSAYRRVARSVDSNRASAGEHRHLGVFAGMPPEPLPQRRSVARMSRHRVVASLTFALLATVGMAATGKAALTASAQAALKPVSSLRARRLCKAGDMSADALARRGFVFQPAGSAVGAIHFSSTRRNDLHPEPSHPSPVRGAAQWSASAASAPTAAARHSHRPEAPAPPNGAAAKSTGRTGAAAARTPARADLERVRKRSSSRGFAEAADSGVR